MKTILMLAGALMLGACASEPTAPPPMSDAPDQCRASSYQRFVGQNRSTLPAQPAGETWRVVCSTCAVTMDYNPSRLNVIYDIDTNIVTQVNCG
ncbi:MAG: I78 family peptidase inhibitor [Brevundimonas sp.]|jgi:hypothetical protein